MIPIYIFDAIVVIIVSIYIIYFIAPFKFSHVLASKQYLVFILGLKKLVQDEKPIYLTNGIVNTNFYFSFWFSDIQPSKFLCCF